MNTLSTQHYAPDLPVGASARDQLLAALPIKQRQLDVAGVSTAVLEGGAGKPVVLLHGPGGYAAHYLRVIPELLTSHQVIAPDLPGHCASKVEAGVLSAERMIGWLDELIEKTC